MSRDSKIALYTIFGTLVAFKFATGIWVVMVQPSIEAAAFMTLVNALWFVLVLIPVAIGGVFWYRRIRARASRRRLIEAEWNVLEPKAGSPPGDRQPVPRGSQRPRG